MASLQYSAEALDTLPLFHRKPYVVYVEGPDDIPFWDIVLKHAGLSAYIIKPAGGEMELRQYLGAVLEQGADVVIASDAHYDEINGTLVDHPRVIYTYGHSIENTLYAPVAISGIIASFLRTTDDYEAEVRKWLDDAATALTDALIRDIANEKHQIGLRVLGDSSAPFLTDQDSPDFSQEKLRELIGRVDAHMTPAMIAEAAQALNSINKPLRYSIRGHFLTHAIWSYIRWRVSGKGKRKAKLSQEALYTMMIAFLESRCSSYDEWQHLKQQVTRLKAA